MPSGPPPTGLTEPFKSLGRLVRQWTFLPSVLTQTMSPWAPRATTTSPATVGVVLGPLFQVLPGQVNVGPIFCAHFSVGGLALRSRANTYSSAPRAPIVYSVSPTMAGPE